MSKNLFDTLKADSRDAAYRVAGTQIIKIAKNGLLQVLQKRNVDNRYINSFASFLDSEFGTAALSALVGAGLSHVPGLKTDKRAQNIAQEFRVSGMALAGNLLADQAIQELLPALSSLLDKLPAPQLASPKIRVSSSQEDEEINDEISIAKAKQVVKF